MSTVTLRIESYGETDQEIETTDQMSINAKLSDTEFNLNLFIEFLLTKKNITDKQKTLAKIKTLALLLPP
ncbi:hypothetical protein A9261_12765 [Vibrio tasmaniensis]|nr:hypothetical protein A9261_12765 [Vibrio tasmaniensis]